MPKRALLTYGRINPFTTGHKEMINFMLSHVGPDNTAFIGLSHTHNNKKNPLTPAEKIVLLKQVYPNTEILLSSKTKSICGIVKNLHNRGFNSVTMTLGENRAKSFNFIKGDKLICPRPPGAMSASKVRQFALNRNLEAFVAATPKYRKKRNLMELIRERLTPKRKRSPSPEAEVKKKKRSPSPEAEVKRTRARTRK